MRLLIPCMECQKELGRPDWGFALAEFRDDSRYELECPRGHKTLTVLQQQRFEVLFEIGAYAISDGYYREAVSCFTASLERFCEFSIRVFLERASKSGGLFEGCWKNVSAQSERQLGAFIFSWASYFGEVPVLLDQKQVKFRNDVIHKGVIPTKEKAVKYGDDVLAILRPQMLMLRERLPKEVQSVVSSHIQNCQPASEEGRRTSTMAISTIVSLTVQDLGHQEKSLEEHLPRLTQWLTQWREAIRQFG